MRKLAVILIPALTAFVFLVFVWQSREEESPDTGGTTSESKEQIAPDFSLMSFDGRDIKLSDLRGKPVVLNFWASWCGPCRLELPLLEKMWQRYKDNGVVFLGVNIMDIEDEARVFIKNFRLSYTNLQNPPGDVASKYGVAVLPVTFFIDKEGKIRGKNFGGFLGKEGEKEFKESIEGVLK